MARLPRVVIPGVPHHVTQRGNRRERTPAAIEARSGLVPALGKVGPKRVIHG